MSDKEWNTKLILGIRNLILSVLVNSIFKNLNTFELSLDC